MNINLLLQIIFFICCIFFVLGIIFVTIDFREKRYIDNMLENFNKRYENRRRIREANELFQGAMDELTFMDKVDELLEKSMIRRVMPFITSEILIAVSILGAVIISYLFYKSYNYIIVAMLMFVAVIFFIYMFLKLLARITYDKIDDQILLYINTLDNFSESTDDIITIMEKASAHLKSPLKEYTEQFVTQARKSSLEKAFKSFKNKVDSRRFQELLKNLEICSRHNANYKEVLKKSRILTKTNMKQKVQRNKNIKEGRLEITVTILLGVFLLSTVSNINENLRSQLQNEAIGKAILAFNLIVLLVGVYKLLTVDRVNY